MAKRTCTPGFSRTSLRCLRSLCRHTPTGIGPTGALPPRPWVYRIRGYRVGRTNERQSRDPAYPYSPPRRRSGRSPALPYPPRGQIRFYSRVRQRAKLPWNRAEFAKDCEDFASDISFETADNLGLAHSFPGAASHVCLGLVVMTKPNHNDAIKSGVGLAGRSRYRIDPAERGEGSLRVEAFRVTPGSDQESGCGVGPYAEGAGQGRCCCPGESAQLRLKILDLRTELTVAAGQRSESVFGRCGGIAQRARPEAGAPHGKGAGRETIESFAKLCGGRNN